MDRQAALDQLELIRPDANEFHAPEFAEAAQYLETDESAREVFLRRQELDRRIARAVRDVPVPEGLKGRLLAAMAENPAGEEAPVAELPRGFKTTRRRWLISALVVTASCLFALLGVWWFHDPEPKLLALGELERDAPYSEAEIAELKPFQGEFEPALPAGLWSSARFGFTSPAKGFAPNRAGSDRVAVYEFTFRDPKNPQAGELRGVMLVVPKSLVDAAPASSSFFGSAYKTKNTDTEPHVAIRSWTENDLVYISMTAIKDDEALGNVLNPPNFG